jgi:hypothetical protein
MIRNPKPIFIAFVISIILALFVGLITFFVADITFSNVLISAIATLLFSVLLFYLQKNKTHIQNHP